MCSLSTDSGSLLEPQLIDRITSAMRKACAGITRDPDELADSVQSAWATLVVELASVRDPTKVVGFAVAVARNGAIQQAKRAKRLREGLARCCPDDLTPVVDEAPVLRQELEDELLSTVMTLPRQRRIAVLGWMHGMSSAAIALCLGGKSPGTARRTVSDGLKQIAPAVRSLLARYERLDEPPETAWTVPVRCMRRPELEKVMRDMEASDGPLTPSEKASVFEAEGGRDDRPRRSKRGRAHR